MRIQLRSAGFSCLIATSALAAPAPSPAWTFRAEMLDPYFQCELYVNEVAQLERLYGSVPPDRREQVSQCIADSKEKMKSAYASFISTTPAATVKAAAKELYASQLAYAAVVRSEHGRNIAQGSLEATAVNKAMANFEIEAGL